MDPIGDTAVSRAQLADAQADSRLWLSVAESNEERLYVRLMQERLGDMERILDRIELGGGRDEQSRWKQNVEGFLDAFRGAREARGSIVGSRLSRLAGLFGDASPGSTERQDKPLAWRDIEIAFLSDERVEILSGGDSRKTYNYGELGFEDRRNGKPSRAWVMLRELAGLGGEMPRPPAGQARVMAQKRIEEIREKLRSHFGIEGDPIPFNGSTYKASFKLTHRRSFDS